METRHLDVWTAVVLEATPNTLERLGDVIDLANPPDFLSFVCRHWEIYKSVADKSGGGLLIDDKIILRPVIQAY